MKPVEYVDKIVLNLVIHFSKTLLFTTESSFVGIVGV